MSSIFLKHARSAFVCGPHCAVGAGVGLVDVDGDVGGALPVVDGATVGVLVEPSGVGALVVTEGEPVVTRCEGTAVGEEVATGRALGDVVGATDTGFKVVGIADGTFVGARDTGFKVVGIADGTFVGAIVCVGAVLGESLGRSDGVVVGISVGGVVGGPNTRPFVEVRQTAKRISQCMTSFMLNVILPPLRHSFMSIVVSVMSCR